MVRHPPPAAGTSMDVSTAVIRPPPQVVSGYECYSPRSHSRLELHSDAVPGRPQRRVHQLEAADAAREVVGVRPACLDIEQVLLPLGAEAVGELLVVGHLLPLPAEVL